MPQGQACHRNQAETVKNMETLLRGAVPESAYRLTPGSSQRRVGTVDRAPRKRMFKREPGLPSLSDQDMHRAQPGAIPGDGDQELDGGSLSPSAQKQPAMSATSEAS